MLVYFNKEDNHYKPVDFSEISYYEENHIPLHNKTINDELIEWFNGENWIFPKPESKVFRTSPNTEQIELLAKISSQLDTLISNNEER